MFTDRAKYPELSAVRVAVVDNFQGEQNKIILLSLVRNNDQNSIGYLALQNRICVALSRAQHGLFMVGNMRLLAHKSPIWKSIESQLIKTNAIEQDMPLKCSTHGIITKVNYWLRKIANN